MVMLLILILMLMMFRHGLRVGEAVGSKCGLSWDAVSMDLMVIALICK